MNSTEKFNSYSKDELLSKLVRYCAYQERCLSEVISKLKDLGAKDSEIDEIIAYLKNENYINEERYAQVFITSKFNLKKWGKYKIRQHLMQKRINKELISKYLHTQIDPDKYYDTIEQLVEKKFIQLKSESKVNQYKTARYLQSKGFEGGLIWEAIKSYLAKSNN